MTGRLDGRRALVTGSASGIGAAIAEHFVDQGATVLGIDRVVDGPVAILVCDLADETARDTIAAAAIDRLGRVDILVNCAGVFHPERSVDLTMQSYRDTMAVNLDAPIFLMSRLGRSMAEAGYGRVVNLTSIHGRVSEPTSCSYDASKAALEAATRTFALELGPFGVLVNAIAPGFVATPMSIVNGVDELESEGFRAAYVASGRIPLGRAARPAEIAPLAVFLASEDNTYVTGAVVTIDGGLLAGF